MSSFIVKPEGRKQIWPSDVKVWIYRSCHCGLVFETLGQATLHFQNLGLYSSFNHSIESTREHSLHSKLNLEFARDFGQYKAGTLLGTVQRHNLLRGIIKSKLPNVSVKGASGTAYGWLEIWGRDKETGFSRMFTAEEDETLKGLGLHPGGNCEGLCYQDQEYYIAKWLGVEVTAQDFPRPEWD
jgi:hypothetical protein